MNNRRQELIDALLTTAKHLERCAHLLSDDLLPELDNDAELIGILPGTTKALNIYNYPDWPKLAHIDREDAARQALTRFDLDGAQVLEYSGGPSLPVAHYTAAQVDLITNDFKFQEQPDNVRIVSDIPDVQYAYGVIWESLEFCRTPVQLLTSFRRQCRKLIIRMRPWSGRNGAFLDNLAFSHLARPVDATVHSKHVRPLSNYERLFGNAGVTVQERQVNSDPVEDFFRDEILATIIERTWGEMRPQEALKIMSTTSIDFITC